jgi:hypothetical protein
VIPLPRATERAAEAGIPRAFSGENLMAVVEVSITPLGTGIGVSRSVEEKL